MLQEPGVKLIAVDFYATWCVPCNKAIPKWKELQEKYRGKGLRLVVISVRSEGSCAMPDWTPDKVVCDYDGDIADRWHANELPQAFLWSWQGNLLVAHGDESKVEKAVEYYFQNIPRIAIEEPKTINRKPLTSEVSTYLKKLLANELKRASKVEIVADDSEMKRIRELRKKSHEMNYDESLKCKLGEDVSANSRLAVTVTDKRLVLEIYSLEKGCLTASATAPFIGANVEGVVQEASYNLIKALLGTVALPDANKRDYAEEIAQKEEEKKELEALLRSEEEQKRQEEEKRMEKERRKKEEESRMMAERERKQKEEETRLRAEREAQEKEKEKRRKEEEAEKIRLAEEKERWQQTVIPEDIEKKRESPRDEISYGYTRPYLWWGVGFMAAGVLATGTAVGLDVTARDKFDGYQVSADEKERKEGISLSTAAFSLYGVGGAMAITGLVLALITKEDKPPLTVAFDDKNIIIGYTFNF